MGTLAAVIGLPRARKKLLVETVVLLSLARLAVLLLPFRWVAPLLGEEGAQTPTVGNPAHVASILAVRKALRKVPKRVPWTSKCLDQAIAGKIMLARRGIPSTVYFGVKSGDKGQIDAHAWLRSGPFYVSGGATRNRFAVINQFADDRA